MFDDNSFIHIYASAIPRGHPFWPVSRSVHLGADDFSP
jgi:hypothetical protein